MLFPLRVWWCFGRKVFVDDDVIARTPIARTLYHIITSSQSIRKSSKTRKKERKKERKDRLVTNSSREKKKRKEKRAQIITKYLKSSALFPSLLGSGLLRRRKGWMRFCPPISIGRTSPRWMSLHHRSSPWESSSFLLVSTAKKVLLFVVRQTSFWWYCVETRKNNKDYSCREQTSSTWSRTVNTPLYIMWIKWHWTKKKERDKKESQVCTRSSPTRRLEKSLFTVHQKGVLFFGRKKSTL